MQITSKLTNETFVTEDSIMEENGKIKGYMEEMIQTRSNP